ncbi:hypothetical protein SADUNF_Sadunf07G0077800 [Salix dunnii]|uniref:Cytochrome P450 n=1 Tax=Salix dunnii TaxID=1413687 RepID=A0A835JZY6_9ROSI|nr:hypothetical protein SADUNF_Sadunf07G0077800 [Salix dunnii]
MVSLFSDFRIGAVDTTATSLQWIIVNLVKYSQIQEKLFMEISGEVDRFGVGGRICPCYGLAMIHHLEYFVANLIWKSKWKAVDGDGFDISEKEELTLVMKNPLHAQISQRSR